MILGYLNPLTFMKFNFSFLTSPEIYHSTLPDLITALSRFTTSYSQLVIHSETVKNNTYHPSVMLEIIFHYLQIIFFWLTVESLALTNFLAFTIFKACYLKHKNYNYLFFFISNQNYTFYELI
jgi:hypothetical protein